MPATTPNLDIPYPLDSDPMSAFPGVAAQAAAITDAVLASFVQSGSWTTTVDANGAFILVFPTPFATPPTVVVMDGGQGSGAAYYKGTSTPPTATQIHLLACRADGSPLSQGAAIRCNWAAIGTRP